MRVILTTIIGLFIIMLCSITWAKSESSPWYSQHNKNQVQINVHLFESSNCPYCQKADAFFRKLETSTPWIKVNRFLINQDKSALERYHQELQAMQINDYSVPAIFFCNARWVGFKDEGTTGNILLRGLTFCKEAIEKKGHLPAETVSAIRQMANASWVESAITKPSSVLAFIPLMALTDAFSPCSFFCLLALFAFVWLYPARGVQLGLGVLFLLVVAITHHIQQGHTLFFYHAMPILRIIAIFVGIALITYVFLIYFKGAGHTQIWATPLLVALTALLVQAYQQTCEPNFGLVFEQWLASGHFSFARKGVYEVFYHIFYILPLLLLLLIFIFFEGKTKLIRFTSMLTCSAWSLLLFIGLLLILYPESLAHFRLSIAVFILSFLNGWLITRQKPRSG